MKVVQFENNPTRWKVVDDTGKTIDDAQGYGFTSKKKAIACYNFKQHVNVHEVKEFKREIRKWWSEHPDADTYISDICWYAVKDGEELTDKDLTKYLTDYMEEHHIEKPAKFHRWQLIKYR